MTAHPRAQAPSTGETGGGHGGSAYARRLLPPAPLAISMAALWGWRHERLAPSLFTGPFLLRLAAWASLALLVGGLGAWLLDRRAAQRPSIHQEGPWLQTWHRLTADRATRAGMSGLLLLSLVALLAPALLPHDPNRIGDGIATHHLPPLSRLHLLARKDGSHLAANEVVLEGDVVRLRRRQNWAALHRSDLKGERPEDWHQTRLHLLGTDHLGRDLLSRLISGSTISMSVGLLSALLSVGLGAVIGGIAGVAGPRLDMALMRLADAVLAFPRLFLLLLLLAVTPGSMAVVVLLLAGTGWMAPSRLVRAEVLSLRERDFVVAARAVGRHPAGILFRHLLPHAATPLLVAASLRVGETILVEAGLSFLGLGVPPPHSTWGNLISSGRPAAIEAWWVVTFPGLAIVATVLLFNSVAEGVRRTTSRG